jgi:uncharacterized protein YdbL (DUF1318 family)
MQLRRARLARALVLPTAVRSEIGAILRAPLGCNHGYNMLMGGDRSAAGEWVLLSYRLPREPSTPRITLWRKLKKLGVAQLADGVVALPADARTREQLEWLADEVIEAGGQAGVWLAHPSTAVQERELATQIAAARAAEYDELASVGSAACDLSPAARMSALRRLRGQWRQVNRRDFFPPPERERAWAALQRLAKATEQVPGDETEEVSR